MFVGQQQYLVHIIRKDVHSVWVVVNMDLSVSGSLYLFLLFVVSLSSDTASRHICTLSMASGSYLRVLQGMSFTLS